MADGKVVYSGSRYTTGSDSTEVYDPSTNTWTILDSLPGSVGSFYSYGNVVQGTGGFLVVGGFDNETDERIEGIYKFDSATFSWQTVDDSFVISNVFSIALERDSVLC